MARLRRCLSWTSNGELVRASARFGNAPLDGPRCSTALIQEEVKSKLIQDGIVMKSYCL